MGRRQLLHSGPTGRPGAWLARDGLSGIPFCSHDVGGFDYSPHFFDNTFHVDFKESYDNLDKDTYPKDPVVYARWLQVGVFSSHLRAHGKQPREPWTYGDEIE